MKNVILILLTSLIALNNNKLSAQNAPVSSIGTYETYDDSVMVSVLVNDFTNIGASDLLITYDSTIAIATSAELGPGVGQFFFISSVDTAGKIYMSWLFFQYGIPGLTMPDSSVFLNISFERINYGLTTIEFDNSSPDNCLYTDGNYDILNDLPYSTYYNNGSLSFDMIDAPVSSATSVEACEGSGPVDIPVTISDFNQIGAFHLTMQYDSLAFNYQSFTNDAGFPGLNLVETSPGTLVANGISDDTAGINLPDNAVLFTLHFGSPGASTALSWFDSGESCKYKGPAPSYEPRNDNPQSVFYIDGNFTELPLPSEAGTISGPSGGMVCHGENGVVFSILPVDHADSYVWTLPEGAAIESGEGSPEITVSFSENAVSGDISVYGINGCGNGAGSPAFTITLESPPTITAQPTSPDTVYADNGIANFFVNADGFNLSYQWQEYANDWLDLSDGGVYSGSISSNLTITNPPLSMNGNYYRCVVSGFCDPPTISDGNAQLVVVVPVGISLHDGQTNNSLDFRSYPNPFSQQVSFSYHAPSNGTVEIEISTIYGERVALLMKKITSKGEAQITTFENHLKPGIYLATITFRNDKQMIRNIQKIIARSD